METYTTLTKEEIIEEIKKLIIRMKSIVPMEEGEAVTTLEKLIGQNYRDRHWCPPSCLTISK